MELNPVYGGLNVMPNNNFESARTKAEASEFEAALKKVNALDKATDENVLAADKELKKACEGFEAMFLSMMYKSMRNTVPEDSLFGQSNAMKIFEDMRDTELMREAASGGGIGLGDMLYRQLAPTVLAQAADESNK